MPGDIRFCKCHEIPMPRRITKEYLSKLCEDHRMLYDNLSWQREVKVLGN
jgi:hypothetical protein